MALKKFKPVTPGQRHKVAITFDELLHLDLKNRYFLRRRELVVEMILVK